MRALAADTTRALQQPLADWRRRWTWACAPATRRAPSARGRTALPTALVTTPESLTLMLTRERAAGAGRRAHRDRRRVARADRQQARRAGAAGAGAAARWNPGWWCGACRPRWATWTRRCTRWWAAPARRPAWCRPHRQGAGHRHPAARPTRALQLGRPPGRADAAAGGRRDRAQRGTTLVFTNVRSQAEIWYQLLLQARPDWAGPGGAAPRLAGQGRARMGRSRAEGRHAEGGGGHLVAGPGRGLPAGGARAADRQRQGRGAAAAARRPQRPRAGPASRVTLVPTNTLELVEAAAARRAALAGQVESRHARSKPLDVLVQHLVTVALGGDDASTPTALFDEVRSAPAYAELRATSSTGRWRFVRTRRRQPDRLPRVPPHRARRRPLARARPRHRAAPPAAGGHHRQPTRRCGLGLGRHARHHRGELHRAAEQGRLLRLRRPACWSTCARRT
jgi:ATP-dependent Lhr-like helicase